MTEQTLQDAILRHALELQRVSAYEEGRADEVLRALTDDLRTLLNSRALSEAGKREVEALIREAEDAIKARYSSIYGMFDAQGLTVHVAERTVEALSSGVVGTFTLPTAETLASLSREVMIEGSPLKAWWAKQAEDTAFRFAAQVRQGWINGETQEQIVGRIVGRRGEPGVMDTSRRYARALVHTATMSSANAARLAVYRKNGKYLSGIRWLATLDSHTCWSAETLVTMADGSFKKISNIQVGDLVLGGVSGAPKRVENTMKRLVQSSVVIHCDGRYVGQATNEHPILSSQGWREAGSFGLSADVPEREVLCRDHIGPEKADTGSQEGGRSREAIRFEQCVAEARRAFGVADIRGEGLRNGLLAGTAFHRGPQHESAERIQHDGRRGWHSWPDSGEVCRDGAEPVAPVLGGPGVSRENAGGAEARCCERGDNPQGLVSDGRGSGVYCATNGQPGMAKGHGGEGEAPSARPNIQGKGATSHQEAVVQSGATREDERCKGGETSRTEGEQSGLEKGEGREGFGHNAGEVARPGVSGEDGGAQCSCYPNREAQGGCCEADADHGQDWLIGSRPEVMGSPEGVKIGVLTATPVDGPVEVYNLSVEDDPTFIAGGVITHNCKTCAALDGQSWDLDGNKLKGTTMLLRFPPAHANCRCVCSPVPRSLNDIFGVTGIDELADSLSRRASKDGPVDGSTNFNDFLARQSPAFVERVLGKRRAELYLAGKLSLRDFVSGTGRPLTLDELGE